MTATLFETTNEKADTNRPLADRLRPTVLDDVIGQDHLKV